MTLISCSFFGQHPKLRKVPLQVPTVLIDLSPFLLGPFLSRCDPVGTLGDFKGSLDRLLNLRLVGLLDVLQLSSVLDVPLPQLVSDVQDSSRASSQPQTQGSISPDRFANPKGNFDVFPTRSPYFLSGS